jgi:hypothetical protein
MRVRSRGLVRKRDGLGKRVMRGGIAAREVIAGIIKYSPQCLQPKEASYVTRWHDHDEVRSSCQQNSSIMIYFIV